MFSLDNQSAKLVNVSMRTENHGQEKVGAIDIAFEIKTGNDVLVEFDPLLRTSLYMRDGAQDDIDPDHLPALKVPKLCMPIKFDWEGIGYGLTVHWGVSGKDNVEVAECNISKIAFTLQEGGTVVTTFRVQCHPTAKDVGWLYEHQQTDLVITLTPPEGGEDETE